MASGIRSCFESDRVLVLAGLWLLLFCNFTFFSEVLGVYPPVLGNIPFLLSLAGLLFATTLLLLALTAVGRALKPVLIAVFMLSSMTAYYMDSYSVIISPEIVQSSLQTDSAEAMGMLSGKFFLYLALFGLLPSVVLFRATIPRRKLTAAMLRRGRLIALALVAVVAILAVFNSAYASFFREYKSIRFYANPLSPIYSVYKYVDGQGGSEKLPHRQIGLDAKVAPHRGKRRLFVLVVGETARANRFSLNGYPRGTNPQLEKLGVVSFDHVWSCGTATAISVPCMFSLSSRSDYREKIAAHTDNLLDITQRAGIHVVWLDNNSDSKGVALRIPSRNFRDAQINPVCDVECRDEGMLQGVEEYLHEQPSGDILIVLHQMGSHGPEYAKRYPATLEYFSPSCHSNMLEECSAEEIANAYDNSIRYTDSFLGKLVDLLAGKTGEFAPMMLYVSDHGESLGENGIFLHGFPYALAPADQKHVPMIFWAPGEGRGGELLERAEKRRHRTFSHDNLFHTVLGLMEVRTSVYQPSLDIFADA